MLAFRSLPLLLPLALAGCGVAETAPPPVAAAPVAAAPVDSLPPEPARVEPAPLPEPEPSVQERRGAPFAVLSSGRPAPRPERPVVVLRAPEPERLAAREPSPAPEPAPPAGEPPTRREEARPRAAAPAVPEAVRTHRVEWGETWYGIARRYGVAPAALAAANAAVNPERLRAGEVLRVPRGDPGAATAARTHEVGPGDSLWGIARRYGVSMDRLREANRLKDDRVRLGQTLIIPAAEEGR